jgi:hypothetical protein
MPELQSNRRLVADGRPLRHPSPGVPVSVLAAIVEGSGAERIAGAVAGAGHGVGATGVRKAP